MQSSYTDVAAYRSHRGHTEEAAAWLRYPQLLAALPATTNHAESMAMGITQAVTLQLWSLAAADAAAAAPQQISATSLAGPDVHGIYYIQQTTMHDATQFVLSHVVRVK
jgi:hypothetical protein